MQLVIYKDNAVIESIPLIPGEEYSAGRSNENDIVLESPSVSRSHARIRVIDTDSVTIEDVGSTNGTFLAGKKILETRWDNTDSIVLIGDYQLHLTLPREQKIEVIPEELPPREDPSPNNQITLPQQDTKKSFAKKSYQTFPYLIVTLLISLPFTVFAVRDHMALNSHMEKLFQVESKKAEQIWYVNKTQVLNNKLAKASKKLSSGNFQLAQVLLADVLKKDPGNIAAIALQVNIQKKLKLRDDKKSREREHEKKKNQTTQAQKNEQEIAKYIEAIRQDIDKKDYHACISKAGELLQKQPGNKRALKIIDFCNNSLASLKQEQITVSEKEVRKTQLEENLEKVLAQGQALTKKGKYKKAIEIFSTGIKLDPKKDLETTREIEREIKKARGNLGRLVKKYTKKAEKEQRAGNNLRALHYYQLAFQKDPADKIAKSRYLSQLDANHKIAANLYNEAVAYASLGDFSDANSALERARKFAEGNKELLRKINEKTNILKGQ